MQGSGSGTQQIVKRKGLTKSGMCPKTFYSSSELHVHYSRSLGVSDCHWGYLTAKRKKRLKTMRSKKARRETWKQSQSKWYCTSSTLPFAQRSAFALNRTRLQRGMLSYGLKVQRSINLVSSGLMLLQQCGCEPTRCVALGHTFYEGVKNFEFTIIQCRL